MRFLVTRPEPDCRHTAGKVRAAGHVADEVPLMTFAAEAPGSFDLTSVTALAFSSRRAVAALRGHRQLPDLLGLPVFTVGDRTAEACREAGFGTVHSASGDFDALAALIRANRSAYLPGEVLYPAARDRAGDLDRELASAGLRCRTVEVYRMAEVTELPEHVRDLLAASAYDGILIYSRRTAEILLSLLRGYGFDHFFPGLMVYAISRRAAEPVAGSMEVRLAEAPSEKALLELALADC